MMKTLSRPPRSCVSALASIAERDVALHQRLIERRALVLDQRRERADRRLAGLRVAGNRIGEIENFERKRKLRFDRLSRSTATGLRFGYGGSVLGGNRSEVALRFGEDGRVVRRRRRRPASRCSARTIRGSSARCRRRSRCATSLRLPTGVRPSGWPGNAAARTRASRLKNGELSSPSISLSTALRSTAQSDARSAACCMRSASMKSATSSLSAGISK